MCRHAIGRPTGVIVTLAIVVVALAACGASAETRPQGKPEVPPIRLGAGNLVPNCATPERLMAFLATRNDNLDPRFRDIARLYRQHGEVWRVRWDYAFFQMAIETNFLTYRRPDGRWGDVDPKQNNFAGIGTTGGGVPGDSYPDVSTGVLAQIQHLVVYSGERIEEPVAPRTRLKQDHILLASEPVVAKRPMTFQDLSGRWAVDKAYGRSINWVAEQFATRFCGGRYDQPAVVTARATPPAPVEARPQPATAPRGSQMPPVPTSAPVVARATSASAPPSSDCRVQLASFGGTKTVLIRRDGPSATELTALTVVDGFEQTMVQSFLETHARGGQWLASFPNRAEALAHAYGLCPNAPR
jgi:hypothetical protein